MAKKGERKPSLPTLPRSAFYADPVVFSPSAVLTPMQTPLKLSKHPLDDLELTPICHRDHLEFDKNEADPFELPALESLPSHHTTRREEPQLPNTAHKAPPPAVSRGATPPKNDELPAANFAATLPSNLRTDRIRRHASDRLLFCRRPLLSSIVAVEDIEPKLE